MTDASLHPPEALSPTIAAVAPVRKAYEQVADQLVALMHAGKLVPGARLPNEAALAREFRVSRATIREALRVLAAHRLIRTTKGPNGGSFVTVPTVDGISEYLRSSVDLLRQAQHVTLEEFLEARELLEIPAARLAARRHSPEHLERLTATIPYGSSAGGDGAFEQHTTFHTVLIETCGNTLLYIAAQPVFDVLQRALAQSTPPPNFNRAVDEQHSQIVEAIRSGDPDASEEEMRRHLEFLRPYHERAWLDATRPH